MLGIFFFLHPTSGRATYLCTHLHTYIPTELVSRPLGMGSTRFGLGGPQSEKRNIIYPPSYMAGLCNLTHRPASFLSGRERVVLSIALFFLHNWRSFPHFLTFLAWFNNPEQQMERRSQTSIHRNVDLPHPHSSP